MLNCRLNARYIIDRFNRDRFENQIIRPVRDDVDGFLRQGPDEGLGVNVGHVVCCGELITETKLLRLGRAELLWNDVMDCGDNFSVPEQISRNMIPTPIAQKP